MKIQKASELHECPQINMLVYGVAGTGKTTFAGTAKGVLIVDLEGGSLPLRDTEATIAVCKTMQDVTDAIKYAIDHGFKAIAIDSLTRLCDIAMDEILYKSRRSRPQMQDWGTLITLIKNLIWQLQSASISIILIALVKEIEADESLKLRPDVPGQLKAHIPAIVDIVGYMTVVNKSRMLIVTPTENDRFLAKDRSGKLGRSVEPDFEAILAKVAGSTQAVTPPATSPATSPVAPPDHPTSPDEMPPEYYMQQPEQHTLQPEQHTDAHVRQADIKPMPQKHQARLTVPQRRELIAFFEQKGISLGLVQQVMRELFHTEHTTDLTPGDAFALKKHCLELQKQGVA